MAFDIPIDKDVVRKILAHHHRLGQGSGGPSWLTFLGHVKDSLWSIDLFRCESATLRTHWVLVVMDQYTRRIIGFGVHAGTVDGVALQNYGFLGGRLHSSTSPWQPFVDITKADRYLVCHAHQLVHLGPCRD